MLEWLESIPTNKLEEVYASLKMEYLPTYSFETLDRLVALGGDVIKWMRTCTFNDVQCSSETKRLAVEYRKTLLKTFPTSL